MIDIQHDSPIPIHEQITTQLMTHIAAGDVVAGTRLTDYRSFAQELLTNPQVVARAYSDLEWEGVLQKCAGGGVEVTPEAQVICRARLVEIARDRLRQAVRQGLAAGLGAAELREVVEHTLTTQAAPPLSADELAGAIKKPSFSEEGGSRPGPSRPPEAPASRNRPRPSRESSSHASSHRDSQDIQDLSRKKGGRSP